MYTETDIQSNMLLNHQRHKYFQHYYGMMTKYQNNALCLSTLWQHKLYRGAVSPAAILIMHSTHNALREHEPLVNLAAAITTITRLYSHNMP